jgi:hypothetical protein
VSERWNGGTWPKCIQAECEARAEYVYSPAASGAIGPWFGVCDAHWRAWRRRLNAKRRMDAPVRTGEAA